MKIAVSSTGKTLNDGLDRRFGRTRYFVRYDDATGVVDAFDNQQNLNAMQGAGIQAAMQVAAAEVQAVITGHCGPKAFRVLQEAGIKVYLCQAATVAQALELWRQGSLSPAENADVEGHWA